jgi:archaellum component FlaD/FlaE
MSSLVSSLFGSKEPPSRTLPIFENKEQYQNIAPKVPQARKRRPRKKDKEEPVKRQKTEDADEKDETNDVDASKNKVSDAEKELCSKSLSLLRFSCFYNAQRSPLTLFSVQPSLWETYHSIRIANH